MHILVLGAAGMVGRKLVERLLRDGRLGKSDINKLTLHDVVAPAKPEKAGLSVECVAGDFAVAGAAEKLIAGRPDVIFHLAAIVSGEAELDFDKGYRINLDGTRMLLDADPASRRRLQAARGVHILDRGVRRAVPGGDRRRVLPHAAAELRHPEGDRRIAAGRLFAPRIPRRHRHPPADHLHPARPAEQGGVGILLQHPARAAGGQGSVLPVSEDVRHWHATPRSAVGFLLHAATMDLAAAGRAPQSHDARPVGDRRRADRGLEAGGGREGRRAHQARAGPFIMGIVAGWPRNFEAKRARQLGFTTAERPSTTSSGFTSKTSSAANSSPRA